MGRYDLPEPKCNHKHAVRVMAGSYDGAHASTWVCDRPACVEDAKEWARAHHYGEPVVIPRGGGEGTDAG